MNSIIVAQDVAAIWFTLVFGACLLIPVFKATWNMGRAK